MTFKRPWRQGDIKQWWVCSLCCVLRWLWNMLLAGTTRHYIKSGPFLLAERT